MKIQQRFKCQRHDVFTEEINKISLSPSDDKRMQSNNFIKRYLHGRCSEWKERD